MNFYLVVPLLSAIVSACFGAVTILVGPTQRANRAAGALMLGVASPCSTPSPRSCSYSPWPRRGWPKTCSPCRGATAWFRGRCFRRGCSGPWPAHRGPSRPGSATSARSNLNQLRSQWLQFSSALEKGEGASDLREMAVEWEELIDESLEGVNRAVMIVRDIREFSHAGAEKSEMADLGQLLDQVLRVAAPQLPAGARVEKQYGVQSPILCEPQRIEQLFLNLVINAAQAIEENGRIQVRSRQLDDFAVVSVEDDGCGIEPAVVERIFDPFFTTKSVGIGTGLGLSISHEIVRKHGGSIEVDSKPGRGTTIRVRLRLADSERAHRDPV